MLSRELFNSWKTSICCLCTRDSTLKRSLVALLSRYIIHNFCASIQLIIIIAKQTYVQTGEGQVGMKVKVTRWAADGGDASRGVEAVQRQKMRMRMQEEEGQQYHQYPAQLPTRVGATPCGPSPSSLPSRMWV